MSIGPQSQKLRPNIIFAWFWGGVFVKHLTTHKVSHFLIIFSTKYNSFTLKKLHFFREVKRRGQKIYLLRILKMWHGERGNWSKILFRMLWQRRREKQKFRSFITFSTSSTYTGFSLCDTFWPKILHRLTHFQDSFVFILSFLFPYTRCRQISDLMQWILPEFHALSQI